MKLLILGSDRNNDFECQRRENIMLTEEVAMELAHRKHSIITLGSGGLQGTLAEIYKRSGGTDWTALYAQGEEQDSNARLKSGRAPDHEILSGVPYPIVDPNYSGLYEGAVALAGRSKTLGDIIYVALRKEQGVFQLKTGNNMELLPKMSDLYLKVYFSSRASCGLNFLEGKL